MRRFTAAELDTGHVPVTQGLAPAPSLSEALLRECRDMGPTLESRVSGPLAPSRTVFVSGWCGLAGLAELAGLAGLDALSWLAELCWRACWLASGTPKT